MTCPLSREQGTKLSKLKLVPKKSSLANFLPSFRLRAEKTIMKFVPCPAELSHWCQHVRSQQKWIEKVPV